MIAKNRSVVGERPIGENHHRSKLTDGEVLAIRSEYDGCYGSIAKLARRYGVSGPNVSAILAGQTWKHLERMNTLQKYGDKRSGQVLPEPGDDTKTASGNFTEEDRKALAAESAEAEVDAERDS